MLSSSRLASAADCASRASPRRASISGSLASSSSMCACIASCECSACRASTSLPCSEALSVRASTCVVCGKQLVGYCCASTRQLHLEIDAAVLRCLPPLAQLAELRLHLGRHARQPRPARAASGLALDERHGPCGLGRA
eukprot:scaffold15752_cov69-Phaeocystis_antarctica.AAC.3